MARNTLTYTEVLHDLRGRKYSTLYFLFGEEPYYIDALTNYIIENVLTEDEKAFNQTIFYGKDTSPEQVLDQCRRFPLMAERQLVVLKEAQNWRIDQLAQLKTYIEKPVPFTLLVICYKYKKLDGRTELSKSLATHSVFFESVKLYDDKIPGWIKGYIASKGYQVSEKASLLLAEYLGNDLEKITNEVGKLMINVAPSEAITEDLIEKLIGISKDFNVFELQNALRDKNIYKANQISRYFADNPADNPIQKTLPLLFNYFAKLMIYHSLTDKSDYAVASALGTSTWFVKDYIIAGRNYPQVKVRKIMSYIREYSARAVGIENDRTPPSELLHELIFKILHL